MHTAVRIFYFGRLISHCALADAVVLLLFDLGAHSQKKNSLHIQNLFLRQINIIIQFPNLTMRWRNPFKLSRAFAFTLILPPAPAEPIFPNNKNRLRQPGIKVNDVTCAASYFSQSSRYLHLSGAFVTRLNVCFYQQMRSEKCLHLSENLWSMGHFNPFALQNQ
jgi:hypothetical protein